MGKYVEHQITKDCIIKSESGELSLTRFNKTIQWTYMPGANAPLSILNTSEKQTRTSQSYNSNESRRFDSRGLITLNLYTNGTNDYHALTEASLVCSSDVSQDISIWANHFHTHTKPQKPQEPTTNWAREVTGPSSKSPSNLPRKKPRSHREHEKGENPERGKRRKRQK